MKILLAEDVRAVAAVMAARLRSIGHEVVVAENGQVAVDRFLEVAPDLVLMDIEMPVMRGFEAATKIRAIEATQEWAWTPILFLTATDTVENLLAAIEAGGDDFMAKTVPESVLHAKMKALSRVAMLRERLSVANRQLAEIASRDGLTGLCNRRSLDLRADSDWECALQEGLPFGLLMLDIDNFKKYNDRYGHQLGDDCLRGVAASIANVVDEANAEGATRQAFAARYGGEEFVVVIPSASEPAYEALAALMVGAIQNLAIAHEENADWGVVTVSVGGAHLARADGHLVALFRCADERLYRAKANGRNRAELR